MTTDVSAKSANLSLLAGQSLANTISAMCVSLLASSLIRFSHLCTQASTCGRSFAEIFGPNSKLWEALELVARKDLVKLFADQRQPK